jgi:protein-S-isoprenylcysteine O-methyltransferase Ste14
VSRLRTVGLFGFVLATCAAIIAAGGGWPFLGRPVAIVYLALWLVWWLAIALGRQRGVESKCDRSQAGIMVLGILALVVLIVAVPWEYGRFSGPIPRDGWLAWMGLALFALGIGLQVAAFRSLRGMYTSRLGIQPEHRLVSSGPYRVIRHPGYLSNILCLAGIGLAMSSLLGLGVSVAVIPLVLARIRQEESMLQAEFGDAYREYRSRTHRFIPGLF